MNFSKATIYVLAILVVISPVVFAAISVPSQGKGSPNDNSVITQDDKGNWKADPPGTGIEINPPGRPFIILSDDKQLKKDLMVRHDFGNYFTADLTQMDVDRLNSRGIATEPVRLYQPLKPPGACDPWPECRSDGGGNDTREYFPEDQTPWGIERVYNDTTITNTSGGAEIDVAVLDTGVYKDHLDLKNRVTQCVDFTGGPPGTVRVKEGKCDDKDGHGTHVAGTIAADGGSDGKGIYGVAPGANIFAYKVCEPSGCWTDDIAAAIDYSSDHGAEIVSMSLGGNSESSLISDAIERNANLLFVAAAGNDGPELESLDYPGANTNVIAVGATYKTDTVPDFSSRGSDTSGDDGIQTGEIEVAAPGVYIESTWNDGGYKIISGTSMATPHVSGLAAKFWGSGKADLNSDGTTTVAEVRAYIQDRAMKTDIISGKYAKAGYDPASGYGLPTVE